MDEREKLRKAMLADVGTAGQEELAEAAELYDRMVAGERAKWVKDIEEAAESEPTLREAWADVVDGLLMEDEDQGNYETVQAADRFSAIFPPYLEAIGDHDAEYVRYTIEAFEADKSIVGMVRRLVRVGKLEAALGTAESEAKLYRDRWESMANQTATLGTFLRAATPNNVLTGSVYKAAEMAIRELQAKVSKLRGDVSNRVLDAQVAKASLDGERKERESLEQQVDWFQEAAEKANECIEVKDVKDAELKEVESHRDLLLARKIRSDELEIENSILRSRMSSTVERRCTTAIADKEAEGWRADLAEKEQQLLSEQLGKLEQQVRMEISKAEEYKEQTKRATGQTDELVARIDVFQGFLNEVIGIDGGHDPLNSACGWMENALSQVEMLGRKLSVESGRADQGKKEVLFLSNQIERLGRFIMAEVPGEPSQSEGAVDCAIRVITELQARCQEWKDAVVGTAEICRCQSTWGSLTCDRTGEHTRHGNVETPQLEWTDTEWIIHECEDRERLFKRSVFEKPDGTDGNITSW